MGSCRSFKAALLGEKETEHGGRLTHCLWQLSPRKTNLSLKMVQAAGSNPTHCQTKRAGLGPSTHITSPRPDAAQRCLSWLHTAPGPAEASPAILEAEQPLDAAQRQPGWVQRQTDTTGHQGPGLFGTNSKISKLHAGEDRATPGVWFS